MSTTESGVFPTAQISEFISSLENCEWALTRSREAIKSVIAALKGQQQIAAPGATTVREKTTESNTPVLKIEPDNPANDANPAREGVNDGVKVC
jgi:hypothetical protein